jgi:hypothetical protein
VEATSGTSDHAALERNTGPASAPSFNMVTTVRVPTRRSCMTGPCCGVDRKIVEILRLDGQGVLQMFLGVSSLLRGTYHDQAPLKPRP